MGVAVGASEALPFTRPDIVAYAVRYAAGLGGGQLPADDDSKLVQWIDL